MRKYSILTNDCSNLASEVLDYLHNKYDIDDEKNLSCTFHEFDPADLSNTSVNSTFSGLTLRAVCHATINTDAMFHHCCDQSLMCIPLSACESTVLNVYGTVEGSVRQLQPIPHYLPKDCILEQSIPLTHPIILRPYTPFKMISADATKLSHVLSLWFHEDTSSYFA